MSDGAVTQLMMTILVNQQAVMSHKSKVSIWKMKGMGLWVSWTPHEGVLLGAAINGMSWLVKDINGTEDVTDQ